MSAKKQLKEALEGASNEVDGFRIQLTNLMLQVSVLCSHCGDEGHHKQ
jgi:hypothetical protein